MSLNLTTCYFLSIGGFDGSRAGQVTNIITAVANCLFSIVSVLGNALVIYVIWKREALHVPYNTLLGCLALSDFVVGLIGQPSMVMYKVMDISQESFATYCVARVVQSCSGWLTAGVSLFTLCAISLDRFLALRLHLRYAAVVTVTRVVEAVIFFWVFGAVFIAMRFVVKERVWMLSAFVFMLTNIVLIFSFYAKVFQIIRRHRRQIHARLQLAQHFHGRSAVEVARHKRSAVTMMYVLVAFIVCYVPFLATIVAETLYGYSVGVKIAYDISATFVFLSSSLNPLLYCWRIKTVRRAAVRILRRVVRVRKPAAELATELTMHSAATLH